MADEKKDSNIGEDIGKIVQDAISSVNYEQLGSMISSTVDKALVEAKKGIKKGQYQVEKSIKAAQVAATNQPPKPKPMRAPVAKSPAGTVSGPFLVVGSVVTIIAAAGMAGAALIGGLGIGLQIVSAGLLVLGGYMGGKAKSLMNRVTRFRKYVKQLGGRAYVDTKELADTIGKSQRYVGKDLNRMIEARMFPEGRITDDGQMLLLSDDAYEAYKKMKEGERLQQEAIQRQQQAEEQQRRLEAENPVYKEVRLVIEEGEANIRQIQEANAAIPEESVSRKLDRLETIIRKIFDFIQKNPDQLMEIRRFMGYYLPTTLKLVNAYKDLEAEPVQGPNIKRSKDEIEETLDTISSAFEKLLDSFYQDTAMDISTDISVMKTMFAQEGLTEDGLMQINKES